MGKSAAQITKPKPQPKPEPIPPLRDGDCMGVDEFLRRYAADKEVYSAELLQGVVHITRRRVIQDGKEMIVPPISADGHAKPDNQLQTWFGVYSAHTPGVQALSPVTTILPSKETGLEPDAVLRILPECGGGSTIGADKFVHGRPELLAEISFTSGSRDFGKKFDAYQADGVPEYLIWRTEEKEIHWFALKRKKYVALQPHSDGTLRSEQFPGLWLDVPALLAGDMAKVLATLQQGIASPEHTAFVTKLQKAAKKKK
ncbi:MAG: Uma2 family endonuclease [Planctomycetia bacterium]|nr:Uma2 family endonuclease [Planctomycetia bacterium]